MKGIRISLSYQDTISIICIFNHIVKNKTDEYDIAVIESLEHQLIEKFNKANEYEKIKIVK